MQTHGRDEVVVRPDADGRICVIHPSPAAPIMQRDGKGT